MAGAPGAISAVEIAQQHLKEQQGPSKLKEGLSKFDKAMEANGPRASEGAARVDGPHAADGAQRVEVNRPVEQVNKTQMSLPSDPVARKSEASKVSASMTSLLADIERGQSVMDKLISSATSGKEFNNSELIALQAGMYKYTQELELTGKVVEKATTGLKDTLKTQV